MNEIELHLDMTRAVDYHYDKFPPSEIDYKNLVVPLAKASDALGRFDQMLKNMHNSEILLAPLRNQEAVISSRMEGTVSTMDEILQYEADHSADENPEKKYRQDVIETILYQRALKAAQVAIEEGQPISSFFIRRLHQHLLSIGRGATKSPGQFKTEQNYLTDRSKKNVLFTPIKPEHLQDGLEKLLNYYESCEDQELIKVSISHLEFEALHPFKDGNGRVGRMLVTLMLWTKGIISKPHFYISGYLEEYKDEYIDQMRSVSATNEWTNWCRFFLEAIESQAIRNLKIAENIQNLYNDMKLQFGDLLSSKYSINALEFIFANPYFRNNNFILGAEIPATTATRFTKVLVENEILENVEEASGRRSALYSFKPLLELVRV